MKKILLIAYDLNPSVGSECRKAYLWLNILAKYFYVHVLVCAVHRKVLEKEQLDNIKFEFIPVPLWLHSFCTKTNAYNLVVTNFMQKVDNAFKHRGISDYTLIHCLTPSGIYSYNSLFKFGLPVVIGPLGGALATPKGFEQIFAEQPFKLVLRKLFYKMIMCQKAWKVYFENAVKIIVGTEYVKNQLPIKAQEKCTTIFDTVVDASYWVPIPRRSKRVTVLYVARLESLKGIFLLLEAVKQCVMDGMEGFEVIVAGAGPLEKKIVRFIHHSDLGEYIKLLGKLSAAELKIQYQQADIFCLPTLREPGGGSILEAMASGLPVITSDYGGPKYSVTEDCGIKIKVNNYDQYVKDLVKALKVLINDKELRETMGKNSRKRIEQEYSMEALEKKILTVYNDILNEK